MEEANLEFAVFLHYRHPPVEAGIDAGFLIREKLETAPAAEAVVGHMSRQRWELALAAAKIRGGRVIVAVLKSVRRSGMVAFFGDEQGQLFGGELLLQSGGEH